MNHRNATLELGLHFCLARGRETHFAKLVILLAKGIAGESGGEPGDNDQSFRFQRHLHARFSAWHTGLRFTNEMAAWDSKHPNMMPSTRQASEILHPPFLEGP